jgi:cobalt-zinc-cadmium resistance protein CzcA
LALNSTAEAPMILAAIPVAFVGSILALLVSGEMWNVSSFVGLIGLFGIAVQNGLVLVTQTRVLLAEGKPLREASIGRVRPKLMTASIAICGLLPILLLRMHGTEIERPLAAGIANDLSMVYETHGRRACSVNVNGARFQSHGMGRDLRVFSF